MRKFLHVYKQLFIMNLGVLFAHRAAFINHLIGGTVWGVFSFIVMLLLTNNVKSIFTWSKGDILLLTGMLSVILGVFNMFFQANFDAFPVLVNKGKIDAFLLKPFDAQVALSIWNMQIISFSRALIGVFFIFYVSIKYHMHLSTSGLVAFIPVSLIGLGLYYAIWSIVTTLTIWFDRATNIVELLHSLQGIMRLPPVVFQEISVVLLVLVFPLTIIATVPVEVALGRPFNLDIILLLILSLLFLFACRKFWLFALRSYTSVSS